MEKTTINLTPTWQTTMKILINVLRNGTAEGAKLAETELMKIAKYLDENKQPLTT